jgi:hypothetical protein
MTSMHTGPNLISRPSSGTRSSQTQLLQHGSLESVQTIILTLFLNRGLGSGDEIKNTGDENEEENTEDERDDREASRLSTERMHTFEIGNQSRGPEATNMYVYNVWNFLSALVKFIISIHIDNAHNLYPASYYPVSVSFV